MIELFFLITLLISIAGIVFILSKKMPALNTLPHHGSAGIKKHKAVLKIQSKVKRISTYFENQIILHKLLSWIKIATLKVERIVDEKLHKIRKKAQKKNKPE